MRLNVFIPSRNSRTTLYIDPYLFKLFDACLHSEPDYPSTLDLIKTIALDTPPYTTPTKYVRSYLEDFILEGIEIPFPEGCDLCNVAIGCDGSC